MNKDALLDQIHAWMQGDPFVAWVNANTFDRHYDKHSADFSVWLHK